ncbi:MAG: carboxypeptidase-like regulatory domain-containing protein, partial [Bacteroidota bacterium]
MKHFTKMFLGTLIILLGGQMFSLAHAQQALAYQNQPIPEVQQRQQTLQSVLRELEEQYHVNFTYQSEIVEKKQVKPPSFKEKALDLDGVLDELLAPLDLQYRKVENGYYLIYPTQNGQELPKKVQSKVSRSLSVDAPSIIGQRRFITVNPGGQTIPQAQTISGQVTDLVSGEALPGVNILAKGTSAGTVTDIEGNYRLTVDDEVTTLVFSSIGYETIEETINGRSTVSIALSPDIQSLSEVVVIGYGTEKKINLTGSVSTVDGEELTQVPSASTSGLLAGRFPGLITNQASGLPGEDQTNISIRGFAGDPLILVDGVQVEGG